MAKNAFGRMCGSSRFESNDSIIYSLSIKYTCNCVGEKYVQSEKRNDTPPSLLFVLIIY